MSGVVTRPGAEGADSGWGSELPTVRNTGLSTQYGALAADLFGPEASWGTPPFIQPLPQLQPLIARCVMYTWHVEKMRIEREVVRLDQTVGEVQQGYAGKSEVLGLVPR